MLIGVGVGVLIAGVILVIVLVSGGNDHKGGVAAPEDLAACLKEHGIQYVMLGPPAPDAAGGTAAVAVGSREQDPLYGSIIEITYFGNAAAAGDYLYQASQLANREPLADTVIVDYSASFGLGGPLELESIKTCVSH